MDHLKKTPDFSHMGAPKGVWLRAGNLLYVLGADHANVKEVNITQYSDSRHRDVTAAAASAVKCLMPLFDGAVLAREVAAKGEQSASLSWDAQTAALEAYMVGAWPQHAGKKIRTIFNGSTILMDTVHGVVSRANKINDSGRACESEDLADMFVYAALPEGWLMVVAENNAGERLMFMAPVEVYMPREAD